MYSIMKNQNDSIEQEVDELLEMAKSKKFKSGIYNFCDRWCEKCKDTEKCFLYAQEMQRKIHNIIEGRGEDGWLGEIKHNLGITKRLLERGLREEKIDFEKISKEKAKKRWDDNAHKRYNKVRCLINAKKYMEEVSDFLTGFYESQYYPALDMRVSFDDIKDEIETITWYHMLLPVKIWRALYEKECCQREKDKDLKKLLKNDFKNFYFLVIKCINKSVKAWRNLAKKRGEMSECAKYFSTLLRNIEGGFKNKMGDY